MPTLAEVAALTFDAVLAQATAAETVAMLLHYGYIAEDPETVPADLKGPGVLDFLRYNENAHSANNGTSYTGLLIDPDNPSTQLESFAVLNGLAAEFAQGKRAFLDLHFTPPRVHAIATQRPQTTAGDAAKTHRAMCSGATGETTPDLLATVIPWWPPGNAFTVEASPSPTTTVFKLSSGASGTNDIYNGAIIWFPNLANGDRYKQWSQVVDYDGASKTITISPALAHAPVSGDNVRISSTPASAKSTLDSRPAGYRSIALSIFLTPPVTIAAVPSRSIAAYDYEFTTATTGGPWFTIWESIVPAYVGKWFEYLESLGGVFDFVLNDFEVVPSIWKSFLTEAVVTGGGSLSTDLENALGWDLDQFAEVQADYLDVYKLQTFRWNTLMMEQNGERMSLLYEAIEEHFPDHNFCDYDSHRVAPGTWLIGPAFSYQPPYGCGQKVGTHVSADPYGGCYRPWSFEESDYLQPAGESWTQPNNTGLNLASSVVKWAGFTCDVMFIRSICVASNLPKAIWANFQNHNSVVQDRNSNALYDSDLWYEKIFALLMSDVQLLYWNAQGVTFQGEDVTDLPLKEALDEFNEILGFETIRPLSLDRVAFDQDLIIHKCDAGGRIVWRIVPNPNVSSTIEQTDAGVTVSAGDTEFVIPYGKIWEADSPVSTAGVWVEQTFPPRSILLHSGFTEPVAVAA